MQESSTHRFLCRLLLSLHEGRGWSLPRTPIRGEGEMKLL